MKLGCYGKKRVSEEREKRNESRRERERERGSRPRETEKESESWMRYSEAETNIEGKRIKDKRQMREIIYMYQYII